MKLNIISVLIVSAHLSGCCTHSGYQQSYEKEKEVALESRKRLLLNSAHDFREISCPIFPEETLITRIELDTVFLEVSASDLRLPKLVELTEFQEVIEEMEQAIEEIASDSGMTGSELAEMSGGYNFGKISEHLQVERRVIKKLLLSGKVRIYDKGSKRYLQSYLVAEYAYLKSPLDAGGGIIFTTKDKECIFIEFTHWIS